MPNYRVRILRAHFLSGTHLKDTTGLTDEMLEKAFGDGDISLPDGLTRPEHWGSEQDAIEKWRGVLGK